MASSARDFAPLLRAISKAADQPDALEAFQPVIFQLLRFENTAHLGFNPSKPLHARLPSSQISYLPIGRDPTRWSLGCFVFAPFAKMPLHDHPGMHGFGRIVAGSLRASTYDWAHDRAAGQAGGPARLRTSLEWLQAPALTCVCPLAGNVHELVAGANGCVMLDALVPDYDDDRGRGCSFYTVRAHSEGRQGSANEAARSGDCHRTVQDATVMLVEAEDTREEGGEEEEEEEEAGDDQKGALSESSTRIKMEEWPPFDFQFDA
jgi:hypothetical protein